MKDFTIDQDTKITLYLKECYGCDRSGKYTPLHQFILDHQIKLTNFVVKRIELNPTWQQEALAFDIELPLLVFENEDGEKVVIAYSEFLDKQGGRESAKPKTKSKGAVSESRATDGTPPIIEKEVYDGEEKDG